MAKNRKVRLFFVLGMAFYYQITPKTILKSNALHSISAIIHYMRQAGPGLYGVRLYGGAVQNRTIWRGV